LLHYLARRGRNLPLLLLLTYRETELNEARALNNLLFELQRERLATRIKLSRLTQDQTRDLLATLFAEAVTPEFLQGIYQETEGNPFFVEEVCKTLIESGQVYRQDGRWQRREMAQLQIPQNVRVAIEIRVGKLPEFAQDGLRWAAVIGRRFEFNTLLPAADLAEDRLIEALEMAERAQLIQEVGATGGGAFSFTHALIPAALLDGLSGLRRRRFHQRVATVLEKLQPDDYEALAHHYTAAFDEGKARLYYGRAAERALATFANETALAYYARLLPLLDEPVEQVDLHLQWGEVLRLLGRYEEAEGHYQQALSQAPAATDYAARSRLGLSKVCADRGDYPAALAWAEQALQGWEMLEDVAGQGQALIQSGLALRLQGKFAPARPVLEKGLALARAAGDRLSMAQALANLAAVAVYQGDQAAARTASEESAALYRELNDKPGIAWSLLRLAHYNQEDGDLVAAQALAEESLAIRREIGDKRGITISLSNLGLAAYRQGNYDAAQTCLDEAMALSREMGDKDIIALLLGNQGEMALNQGHYTLAQAVFAEGLTRYWEMGDHWNFDSFLNQMGRLPLIEGDYAAARALFAEALAISQKMDTRPGTAWSLSNLGYLAVCQGDYDGARPLLAEGLAHYREIGEKEGLAGSLQHMGYLLYLQADYKAAQSLLAESLALNHRLGLNPHVVYTLVGLAAVAAAEGHNGRAVHLAAAAESLRAAIQLALFPLERGIYEKVVAATRETLGEAAFAAAWAEGQALPLDTAVALALAP
jgi:predicted ATPase